MSFSFLSGWLLIVVWLLCGKAASVALGQPTKPKTVTPKRSATTKKAVTGTAQIELTAFAAIPNGQTRPVALREFWLLTIDPQELKSQIEKEFPLPEEPSPTPTLSATHAGRTDLEQVAKQFNVSVEFAALTQKAPQEGSMYHDEPGYRRLEDYARVDELGKFYENLLKKKVKKGNLLILRNEQKLELARLLEEEFQRIPPPDKTALAVGLAQLAVEHENLAFQERRRQMERKKQALQQRLKQLTNRILEMEKSRKAFRTVSTPKGIVKFSRLIPRNYWAFAENFEFEGISAQWNIPIRLQRSETRRIELMIGNR